MKCCECENVIEQDIISVKDILSLNKKLLGRNIDRYFCADCLAEYIGTEKSDFESLVERFKEQGCKLF